MDDGAPTVPPFPRFGGPLEVGVAIPHIGPLADPRFVIDFCRAAERAGFRGLWTADHLAVPLTMTSAYTLPRQPVIVDSEALRSTMGLNLEMLTTLSVAAAVTSTIRLGTNVNVLPLRNPIVNARQIASIDLYRGGRVVLGIGVGWLAEEAKVVGAPWDRRGARADEHVEILRRLWEAPGPVGFDGVFRSFPPIDPNPRPARPIPVLVGGHSRRAIRRAARLGDGWIGAGLSLDRLQSVLADLRDACEVEHRDFDTLGIACGVKVTDGSNPDRLAATLRAYAAAGVHHAVVPVAAESAAATLGSLERWGAEVLPLLG